MEGGSLGEGQTKLWVPAIWLERLPGVLELELDLADGEKKRRPVTGSRVDKSGRVPSVTSDGLVHQLGYGTQDHLEHGG